MKLKFENDSYDLIAEYLKKKKGIWKELSLIKHLEKITLKTCGSNTDLDNFQIFTPRFIVDDMIKGIGIDNITNRKYRILEPTSGDGAFTCRILELRLSKIDSNNPKEIFKESLDSLSTIYSIELDEKLVQEQRNNIYTITMDFLEKKGILLSESEDAILRFVILSNFIWGETNISSSPTIIDCDVAYKMPDARKGEYISVEFPVWNFDIDRVSLHYEAPEMGDW